MRLGRCLGPGLQDPWRSSKSVHSELAENPVQDFRGEKYLDFITKNASFIAKNAVGRSSEIIRKCFRIIQGRHGGVRVAIVPWNERENMQD
jgi:hypothetical protein